MPGYVEPTPDAGRDVVLERLDLGAWSFSNYPNSHVRVVDAPGNTLFDTGRFTFPSNTVFSDPASPIRSSLALRVYISDFGDLELDNFQFSQVATVPEPGTWALWMAGVGLLGDLARLRRVRRDSARFVGQAAIPFGEAWSCRRLCKPTFS